MNLTQIEKEITTTKARLALLETAHSALKQLDGGRVKAASATAGTAPKQRAARKPRTAAAAAVGADGTTLIDAKPTYVEAMIPALEEVDTPDGPGSLHADALLKRLQKHYPEIKRPALDAAMAAEVKKPNARIVRATEHGKGMYSLSPAYRAQLYNREASTTPAEQVSTQTPVQEPEAVSA